MAFPLTVSGCVTMGPLGDPVRATDALAGKLRDLGARRVDHQGERVRFVAGWPNFTSKSRFLSSITSGELVVVPFDGGLRVEWSLKFTQLVVAVTLMVVAWFGPFFWFEFGVSVLACLAILAFIWAWLCCANVLISKGWFESRIRETLRGIGAR